jgi:hypothetical protein
VYVRAYDQGLAHWVDRWDNPTFHFQKTRLDRWGWDSGRRDLEICVSIKPPHPPQFLWYHLAKTHKFTRYVFSTAGPYLTTR